MKEISIKKLCCDAGISRRTYYKYKHKYPELSRYDIIKVVLNTKRKDAEKTKNKKDLKVLKHRLKTSNMTFVEKCNTTGVDYKRAVDYRRYVKQKHNKVLSDEDIIIHYLTKDKPFKEKCRDNGIHPQTATNYKTEHPYLSDDEVIKYFINKGDVGVVSFADKCKRANISYKSALFYRRKHSEQVDEQVILHFNPYCYYNIHGEFIIVPLPDKKEKTI